MPTTPGLTVKVVVERHDGKIVAEYPFGNIVHKIVEQFGLLLPKKRFRRDKRDREFLIALNKAGNNVRVELLKIGLKPDTWLL